MSFREFDVVEFLETAWGTIEARPDDWLDGILRVLRPALDFGLGVHAYFVDASQPDRFEAWGHRVVGAPDAAAAKAGFDAWLGSVPIAFQRRMHTFAPFGSSADLPADITPGDLDASLQAHHHPHMIGVNGLDATGRGCALAAASSMPAALPGGLRATAWGRVATHLGAAVRLRRRLAGRGPGAGDAVLDPTGRCLDATGDAAQRVARAALREGALRIAHARSRRARSPDDSLTLWQSLVAGRWSLVDQFESDGRRYLVAVPNRPEVPSARLFTSTEARILGAMLMGHPNKLIAYELGIAPSTVGTHIARAAAKLGVRGRVALMRRLGEEPGLVTGAGGAD